MFACGMGVLFCCYKNLISSFDLGGNYSHMVCTILSHIKTGINLSGYYMCNVIYLARLVIKLFKLLSLVTYFFFKTVPKQEFHEDKWAYVLVLNVHVLCYWRVPVRSRFYVPDEMALLQNLFTSKRRSCQEEGIKLK